MMNNEEVIGRLTMLTPHLWAAAIVFFGVGDLATTGIGLYLERTVEIGPVASIAYRQYGIPVLIPLKGVTLLLAYVLWYVTPVPHNTGVPLGLAALGVVATFWNLTILFALL